jgi:lysozyme family protein
MSVFDQCFEIVVGFEGGYDTTPGDRGNWTGGVVGRGVLRGTKYGISAAAYPDVDIASLTLAEAKAIYQRDYWAKINGDLLDPRVALIVFDAAVNNGVGMAIRWLQRAAGVTQDNIVGPATAAAANADAPGTCIELLAQRLVYMASLSEWPTFELGWARRLCGLPWKAQGMTP